MGLATLFGKGFFDLFDYLSSNVTMPIGGLCIAIFTGYVMRRADLFDELSNHGTLRNDGRAAFIRVLLRYVTPVLVLVIFLNALGVIKL